LSEGPADRPAVPRSSGVLLSATPIEWAEVAVANLDAVLDDHAHCEKKAAASALSLIAAYPSDDELVRRMSALAVEELQHFRAVHERLVARGGSLGRDRGDPYAQKLLALARPNRGRLVDRLLLLGLIEARSQERLQLLGVHLVERDPGLARFYLQLAEAESRHAEMFLELASRYEPIDVVEERLRELARGEAGILESLPVEPRIH
jgi:tRNA 2-(methylsulfanyl)-N6-isopentenyladenosine37 hydroxylase